MIKNLLLIVCCCFAWSQSFGQLTISEIMYNNPGEDIYEFVEVWNTSGAPINISQYKIDSGFEADFPDIEIPTFTHFWVVADSAAFVAAFGSDFPVVVSTGALNNGGETITITDLAGTEIIDEVSYEDDGDWPSFADGNGASLKLCDLDFDNNLGKNWGLGNVNIGDLVIDNQPIYTEASNDFGLCGLATATFYRNAESVLEGDGIINIPINVEYNFTGSFEITVSSQNISAIEGEDYNILTPTISVKNIDSTDIYNVQVELLDDNIQEADEMFILSFTTNNSPPGVLTSEIEITIIDNDTPLTENLILTGVFDAQPGFGGTKGAEFYAVDDIPDLSAFGVGIVNNGNGTDGVEYTFPATSLAAGSFIYLVEDSTEFADYFGMDADYIFTSINVNGDDAIELFENAQPLDVFGETDIDGSGMAWEYQDGWAYRKSGTGPDGMTFVEQNWTYSGVDALDGPLTNAETGNPFPIGSYSTEAPTEVVAEDDTFDFPVGTMMVSVDVIANDQIPGGIVSLDISTGSVNITQDVTQNFMVNLTIPETYCGTETFTYSVSNGTSSDDAMATINVACPADYPILDIGIVTTEGVQGVADSIGTTCELSGIVYGINLADDGILFTIIDENGDGIAVFNNESDLGYTVTEGDEVSVLGTITQFNGLTEIVADQINRISEANALLPAAVVSTLDESSESRLVRIENVKFVDVAQWGGGNSGFNFSVTDGTNEYQVRIDNNVDLFLMPAPNDIQTLDITGIGGQFDNSSPFEDGYQLLPRYEIDIEMNPLSTQSILASKIEMYPNPTARQLNINSEVSLDRIIITDLLGKEIIIVSHPSQQEVINIFDLVSGIYTVECIQGNDRFAMKLIKR